MALGYQGYQGYGTPDAIRRQREIAEALVAGSLSRAPKNVGEGLTAIGQALAYRRLSNRANKAEAAGRESASAAFNPIIAALGGGSSAFPPAPGGSAPSSPSSPSPTAADYADARVGASHGDSAETIMKGLVERGMPPHIAQGFVMNFRDESNLNPGINEQNPIVPGSRGGFGLAQWTGPRRRALEAYAAERGKPVSDMDTQLDFLMTELQGPEASAWEAIQASADPGSAAAAIVNKFLRPAEEHRARREARYRSSGSGSAPPAVDAVNALAGGGEISLPGINVTAPAPELAMAPPITGGRNVGTAPVPPNQFSPRMDPSRPETIPAMAGGTMDVRQPGTQVAGSGPTVQALMGAMANPWLSENQRAIVGALLEQKMAENDPSRQLDMEYKRAQLEALRNKGDQIPDSVRALQMRAEAAGLQPGSKEYADFMISGGKGPLVSVNTGQGEVGTIPQGYELFTDPNTGARSLRPIPGGPVAAELAAAEEKTSSRVEDAATASDVVTTAASRAREAAGNQDFGPAGTSLVAGIPVIGPMTDSGEVMRQVDVLKNSAAAENLQAMRDASPTGGALGNVTEKELKLLADKSGALDPNSPTFLRDLEDYERTLLRTIHGKEAGDAIFERSRRQSSAEGKPLTEMTDEELEAIINGQ